MHPSSRAAKALGEGAEHIHFAPLGKNLRAGTVGQLGGSQAGHEKGPS